eukprot:gene13689-4596_t
MTGHLTGQVGGHVPNVHRKKIETVEDCMQLMQHISFCESSACTVKGCQRMKKVLWHAKNCKRKMQCKLCRQVIRICVLHARACLTPNCKVVFCSMIRARMVQRQRSLATGAATQTSSSQLNEITHNMVNAASQTTHQTRNFFFQPQQNLPPMQRSFSAGPEPIATANLVLISRSTSLNTNDCIAPETVGSEGGLFLTENPVLNARQGFRFEKDLSVKYSRMDISKQ